ncbi:MAG: hypothetical protein QG570_348 [Patescibacteria group bacterium]|nr:hypothetical protein [Patescibacteria group bacterium]
MEEWYGFFVPARLDDDQKREFIPLEFQHVIDNPIQEPSHTVRPINSCLDFDDILFRFAPDTTRFEEIFALVPDALPVHPARKCLTWNQICSKSFRARYKLNEVKKADLLKSLIENRYLEQKIVGIRKFVYRSPQSPAHSESDS